MLGNMGLYRYFTLASGHSVIHSLPLLRSLYKPERREINGCMAAFVVDAYEVALFISHKEEPITQFSKRFRAITEQHKGGDYG